MMPRKDDSFRPAPIPDPASFTDDPKGYERAVKKRSFYVRKWRHPECDIEGVHPTHTLGEETCFGREKPDITY